MNKPIRTFVFLLLCLPLLAQAGGGMWLPLLLQQLNEADMQAQGLRLSAEDIYSINHSSLKDAVVRFGGGCTGEIISSSGLMLTNHHCGYGQIQKHSSVENDYLTNGFWAMNREEELQNPGLSVTFIVRMEDVTEAILGALTGDESESERQALIAEKIEELSQKSVEGTHYDALIRAFYYGNEYYMFITETFNDVRLVGAPPSSIGNYGQETDNWMWPRHTGDFSVFRIYMAPDGSPAEYSPDNVPLVPRHHFPVSLKGVQEGDFTMVYGFPGTTQEYLTSYAVDMIMHEVDPQRIAIREIRVRVMEEEMRESDKVRIQYSSKLRSVSNGYKKWQGEIWGLTGADALGKKREYEAEFTRRVEENPEWKAKWGTLLSDFEKTYSELTPILLERQLLLEAGYPIEIIQAAYRLAELTNLVMAGADEEAETEKDAIRKWAKGFYKDYHAPLDERIFADMIYFYKTELQESRCPEVINTVTNNFDGDYDKYARFVFENSALVSEEKLLALLDNFDALKFQLDPAYQTMLTLLTPYVTEIAPAYNQLQDHLAILNRSYMEAQRVVFSEKTFFPDANSTLRLTYGKVQGMQPRDGVHYNYYTTLDGVIAKYIPGDEEYDLPSRLLDLHEQKDFGRYANADGELSVCFIASNHTSGGNSGSPVIDADGYLIGLNFDRNWEGTMSDINYDESRCRNISVDIRYVMFLIDKFAGAGYLLEEMDIVSE